MTLIQLLFIRRVALGIDIFSLRRTLSIAHLPRHIDFLPRFLKAPFFLLIEHTKVVDAVCTREETESPPHACARRARRNG